MNAERRRLTAETARRLTIDTEPWLSCDDCFHLLDQYVERLLAGEVEWPAMRAHLTGCTACGDEATSLLLLVAADEGIEPDVALRRLANSIASQNRPAAPRGATRVTWRRRRGR